MQENSVQQAETDLFAQVEWDVATGEVQRSPAWFRMTGYDEDEQDSDAIGFWADRAHPADLVHFYRVLEDFARSGKDELRFNYRLRFADGRWHQLAAVARVVARGRDGRPLKYLIHEIDLEPFHADDLKVAGLSTQLPAGLAGAWSWEPASGEVWWSKEVYEICGWSLDEPPPNLEGQAKLYVPESLTRLYEAIDRLLKEGTSFDLALTLVRTDGRRLPVRATAAITRGRAGSPGRVGGTLALLEPGQRADAATAARAAGPLLELDLPSGDWIASPEAERVITALGGRHEDPSRALRELLTHSSREDLQAWTDGLKSDVAARGSLLLRTVSGRSLRLWPYGGVEGNESVFLRLEIEHEEGGRHVDADHDELTGLLKFRAFELLAENRLANSPQVLFKININAFRRVNAILGHRRGDEVLAAFAAHLSASLPGALLCRRAGDVFVGMMDCRGDGAELEHIREAIEAFVPPRVGLLKLRFALAMVRSDGLLSLPEMIEAASELIEACPPGGSRVFGAEDGQRMERHRRISRQLLGVAARGELRCHYQPSVSAIDGTTCGVETLVRWQSPELGQVSPGDFIPLAEETGEIIAIGRWVLAQAIADFARMRRMGLAIPHVSVNLSPTQFADSGLAGFALEACREHGVEPGAVMIELTESAFIDDGDMTRSVLESLTGAGFLLAMDDFGTGFSNLGVLTRLRLSQVKIDRSFVSRMLEDPASRVVVDSVVRLAHGLSCHTVAEGAERQDQVDALRALGCDQIQGFHIARPMPFDDLVAWQAGRLEAYALPQRGGRA